MAASLSSAASSTKEKSRSPNSPACADPSAMRAPPTLLRDAAARMDAAPFQENDEMARGHDVEASATTGTGSTGFVVPSYQYGATNEPVGARIGTRTRTRE